MTENAPRRRFTGTISGSHRIARNRGQAAVEFALVMIVAMIVLFAAVQMAVIGQAALALGQMNYQGARYAAVNSSASCSQVATYMAGVGSPTITKNGVSCTSCPASGGAVGVQMTCSGGACGTRNFGDPVQVSLCFDASNLLFLSQNFLGVVFPTQLSSTETAMTE
ncbi:MAG TPA: TadE/TadG family type IV pilus assembly protein [Candidatus Binataceae bacterium]|jgi:Flp pilus assembly protein TadG|nr:TadE/TadG family type IV pilus assembly protein [Candidatus Binataceae bacterium]